MPHISNTYKKKKLQKKNGLDKYTDCKIKINLKYKIWFLNNNPTGLSDIMTCWKGFKFVESNLQYIYT